MSNHESYETDVIPTPAGDLKITFLGHGSLMLTFGGKVIHVDPYSHVADYSQLPKADLILITHEHSDHLDITALMQVRTGKTELVINQASLKLVKDGIVMHNGEACGVQGISIEAVPAYNILHKRENGEPFHPKGVGNGYVLTIGSKKVYIAGDTENIPELKNLQGIDVAFLPMNLPFTMTPEMVADAARTFHPRILYPYHFGNTNTDLLVDLLKSEGIEVRIRMMA
ncbi:MAG: MBL fold metallo-hydrolase [Chloroflexi bacterium]|nr:MBL fold metallo-hydrolase [Chloroflexota bacterium]